MLSIISNVTGVLEQKQTNKWISTPIPIPLFNNKLIAFIYKIQLEEPFLFVNEADKQIAKFLSLSVANRENYSLAIFNNCKETLNDLDPEDIDNEDLWNITNPSQIWNFIEPSAIRVCKHIDNEFYIIVTGHCDWEESNLSSLTG